ncbi:ATP-binding protein [Streptomyces sp. NPDC004980]
MAQIGRGGVADRLASARSAAFVGRSHELALFSGALGGETPLSMLYLYGPGGVGKSTLLRRFADMAEGTGRRVVRVDGRDVPSRAGSLREEIGPVVEGEPTVVFIDTFERCQGQERWLR